MSFLSIPPLTGDHGLNQGLLKVPNPVTIETKLFLDGYEDFLDPLPVFSNSFRFSAPSRRCLLDDLMFYWAAEVPAIFCPINPTLLALSYSPLRIIAAEWSNFIMVMNQSIKQVEYSIGDLPALMEQLEHLASDMHSLQGWRRCTMTSLHKISAISYFLKYHSRRTTPKDGRAWNQERGPDQTSVHESITLLMGIDEWKYRERYPASSNQHRRPPPH